MAGKRHLDAKSHATLDVGSGVGFACGAHPVGDALPQRRQIGDLDKPPGRQTHQDQQPRREALTGRRLGHGGRAPRLDKAVEPEQRWEKTERSGPQDNS